MRKPLVEEMTDDLKSIVPEEQRHKFVMQDFCYWLREVEVKCHKDQHSCTQRISELLPGRADVAMELRQMIEQYIKEEL
mgnify:CR=1 FL=1